MTPDEQAFHNLMVDRIAMAHYPANRTVQPSTDAMMKDIAAPVEGAKPKSSFDRMVETLGLK
jgi:hypothetical protein